MPSILTLLIFIEMDDLDTQNQRIGARTVPRPRLSPARPRPLHPASPAHGARCRKGSMGSEGKAPQCHWIRAKMWEFHGNLIGRNLEYHVNIK